MQEENIRQDSFTMGTPSKGGALKVYLDLLNTEETQKKIDNFFQTKEYIKQKYGVDL